MGEYGDIYGAGRERLSGYMAGLDEVQLATAVPACPGWDAKGVVSHVAGIVVDVAAGALDKATDAERQVQERRGASIDAILAEWAEAAPAVEAGLDDLPFEMGSGPLVGDLVVHEGDIRLALGDAPIDDGASLRAALRYYGGKLEGRIAEADLAALRVDHDGAEHVLGEGDPSAAVSASGHDLLRGLSGRRTRDQVRGFDWSGDADPYMAIFAEYGWPESAIE